MGILALDIGNSNMKVGAFEAGELTRFWRIKTDSTSPESVREQVEQFVREEFSESSSFETIFSGLVYCTVVPELEQSIIGPFIERFQMNRARVLRVAPGEVDVPISLGAYPPEQLGPDRWVNVCAAHYLFPGKSALVVDFGTATTFDFLDGEGRFLGGVIAPGLETFWNILGQKTSRLGDVLWYKPESVLGTETSQCMQAGLSAGYAGLYAETLRQIQAQRPDKDFLIIGTGGLVEAFQELTDHAFKMDSIDPWLTLKGLYLVYQHKNNDTLEHSKSEWGPSSL